MVQETQEGDKEHAGLQHVLAATDDLIAGLATAQPAATQRLKQLYLELFGMDVATN